MSDLTVDKAFVEGMASIVAAIAYATVFIRKRRRWPPTFQLLSAALAGPGVVGGLWLAKTGLMPSASLRSAAELMDMRVYLIFGGIALAWVSGQAISKALVAAATSPSGMTGSQSGLP